MSQQSDRHETENQCVIVPEPVILMQDEQEHNKAPNDHFHERSLQRRNREEQIGKDGEAMP